MTNIPSITALGTTWWVELFSLKDKNRSDIIVDDIRAVLQTFEHKYSRFKPDSDISLLNTVGILKSPSTELIDILQYGQNLYRQTDGAFNFLLGKVLEARGYDENYSFTPHDLADETIPNPDTDLEITPEHIVLKRGSIDLGGFGKGYAIDLVATHLQQFHGVDDFLVNGGGDIYVTSDAGEPVTIYLEHPIDNTLMLGTISIKHQGFAASSPHKRSWRHDTKTYHHIINTSHIYEFDTEKDAIFVIANNTTLADAFATAILAADNMPLPTNISTARFSLKTNILQHDSSFPITIFN